MQTGNSNRLERKRGSLQTPAKFTILDKSPWDVLQYSYFSVISRFHHKTVHPFRKFLAVLPPSALYKVETRKKL